MGLGSRFTALARKPWVGTVTVTWVDTSCACDFVDVKYLGYPESFAILAAHKCLNFEF